MSHLSVRGVRASANYGEAELMYTPAVRRRAPPRPRVAITSGKRPTAARVRAKDLFDRLE
jgi:hypothetical protein